MNVVQSHIQMAILFFASLKLTYTSEARSDLSSNSWKKPVTKDHFFQAEILVPLPSCKSEFIFASKMNSSWSALACYVPACERSL